MAGQRRRERDRRWVILSGAVNELWEQREAVIALHSRTPDCKCPECHATWPCPTLYKFNIYTEADWWKRNTPPTVQDHWLDFVERKVARP